MRSNTGAVSVLAAACGLAMGVSFATAQQVRDPVLGAALSRVYPTGRPVLPGEGTSGGSGGGATDVAGPDVIVGELQVSDSGGSLNLNMATQGSNTTHFAYSIGTTSCNVGTQNLLWIASQAKHPVIPQNMYRMKVVQGSVRFEQIGQSWVKHAFTALTQNACLTCNGNGGSVLGIGCSDPYTASRNGSQSNPSQTGSGGTGPRYIINPYTGVYPWPIPTNPAITDSTSRRIRVPKTDIELTNATSSTQYFGEAIYVNWDDARYGNGKNNASYRRMFCSSTATGAMTLEGTGGYNNGIHRATPAIYAWRDYGSISSTPAAPTDSGVVFAEVTTGGVFNPPLDPTGDGWLVVASKATDIGQGLWHYEYAVENLNSDRGGGSFSVHIPAGVTITKSEWHGVDSHSGVASEDGTRNKPWTVNFDGSNLVFSAPDAYAPATPTLGNPIRWGTMYNFRFDCNAAPINNGQVTLGLWKPMAGWPDSLQATAWVPATPICYPDCDYNGTFTSLNVADFTCFLNKFAAGDPYANCDGSTTAPTLNVADFTCFLNKYAAGCP